MCVDHMYVDIVIQLCRYISCADGKRDGMFLVRDNAALARNFVLSFVCYGKVEHYHINENPQAPWVYSLDSGPPMDGRWWLSHCPVARMCPDRHSPVAPKSIHCFALLINTY